MFAFKRPLPVANTASPAVDHVGDNDNTWAPDGPLVTTKHHEQGSTV